MTVSTQRFWIGTYAGKGGPGLIAATISADGAISTGAPEPRIVDASYGIWCDDLQVAWFVCEQDEGMVSGWRHQDGRWHPLGSVSTGGAAPCFLDVSHDRHYLAVANYGSGSVATIMLDAANGAPLFRAGFLQNEGKGCDPDRQDGPHPHCVRFRDDGKRIIFTDLGLDRVFSADVGPGGALTQKGVVFEAKPGFGPRHLVPLANDIGIVLNGELASSLALLDPGGDRQTSLAMVRTDPANKAGNLGGHLVVEGDVVWTSNRGADTLAAFKIGDGSLELLATMPTGGQSPRHFVRAGRYFVIAHEDSATVTTVDAADGRVAFTAEIPGAAFILAGPIC